MFILVVVAVLSWLFIWRLSSKKREAPLVILVGGMSSRLFVLLGWPVLLTKTGPFWKRSHTILGTKILSRVGRAGNMLDVAVHRWPKRPTHLVFPEKYLPIFEHATSGYKHVHVMAEPGEGLGTGGAIEFAARRLAKKGYEEMIVMYGDAFVASADILVQVFKKAEQDLKQSASVLSMILLEQHKFDPGLGYCSCEAGKVTQIIEKPKSAELVRGFYINPAFYVLDLKGYLKSLDNIISDKQAYSFEEEVVPALISRGQVDGYISTYTLWNDLGEPRSYSAKRFDVSENNNRLGVLAGERFCTNVIVHSAVPWFCVWAERLNDRLVSIVPLGIEGCEHLAALIVLPLVEDSRVVAELMKSFREKVIENPEVTYYEALQSGLDYVVIPQPSRSAPYCGRMVCLVHGQFNITCDVAYELDSLPQVTVKGLY